MVKEVLSTFVDMVAADGYIIKCIDNTRHLYSIEDVEYNHSWDYIRGAVRYVENYLRYACGVKVDTVYRLLDYGNSMELMFAIDE